MRDFKEFERGDWVVFDTSKPYCRLLPPCLMKFTLYTIKIDNSLK